MQRRVLVCRRCGEEKIRIRTGKQYSGTYVFTDDLGKRWNGRQCADCTRNEARQRQAARFQPKPPRQASPAVSYRVCKDCQKSVIRIRTEKRHRSSGGIIYTDLNRKVWNGRRCPDCWRVVQTNLARARFSRSIDNSKSPKIKKGREAERIAMKHFESLGFAVQMNRGPGPDLVCHKNGERITVEVKATYRDFSKRRSTSLRIGKLTRLRKNDDFLAIVHDGEVRVMPLSQYKSTVTELFAGAI